MNTSHRRIALLTGASFSAIGLTMVAASPAQAACTITGTSLTCTTTTTTDTFYPANVPNDRVYPGPGTLTDATVTASSIVDGFGLAFGQQASPFIFTNNGTVQWNAASVSGLRPSALYFDFISPSALTYTGPGDLINLGIGDGLAISHSSTGSITANVGGSVLATNGDAIEITASNPGANVISVTTVAGETIRASAGDGIEIDTAGSGNTTVTNAAAIRSAPGTPSTLLDGINVTSTGTGNIAIANTGAIGSAAVPAVVGPPPVAAIPEDRAQGTGITAAIVNGASAGTIGVTGTGAIWSVGNGIDASTTGTGAVTVNYTGAINSSTGDGIQADSTTGALAVTSGAITATAGDGIQATSTTGNQVITVGGNVTGATQGVLAASTSGTIAVNVTGGNVSATAAAGDGIDVSTTGAKTVTISAGRSVTGGTTGNAIIGSGGSTLTVTNNGTLGTANRVAVWSDGITQIIIANNAGATMNGRVDLSSLADSITNAGIWNATGSNNFYADVDTVSNLATGTINTATGTTFSNLEVLTNAGLINVNGTLGFLTVPTAITNAVTGDIFLNSATVTGAGAFINNGYLNLDGASVLNVASYTQGATGTLEYELDAVTPAVRPQILVVGNAALDGTLLANIHTSTGLFADTTTFQDVIDAATQTGTFDVCAISGEFANSAFLDLTCVYSPAAGVGNLDLVLTRAGFDTIPTGNFNGDAVAFGLECIYDPALTGGMNLALNDLLAMDAGQFALAANQLAGSGYSSYLSSFTSLGVHYNDILAKATDCEIPALAGSVLECRTAPTHMWAQVDFQNRNTDGDIEAGGYDADRWTAVVGFDMNVGSAAIVGLSVGKVTNRVDTERYNSLYKASGYQVGAYGVFDPGTFFIKAMGTYNWYDGDSRRNVNFVPLGGTVDGQITGDPDVRMWTLGAHAGMRVSMGASSVLTPYANVDYTNAKLKSFNEGGELSGIGLTVDNSTEKRTTATGGVKWAADIGGVVPELDLGYRYQFGDRRSSFNGYFLNDEDCDFDIYSQREKRGSLLAGASIGGKAGPVDVRVSYQGLYNSNSKSHAGNFKIVLPFGGQAEVVEAPAPYVAPPPPPAPEPEPYVAPPPPPPPPAPSGERG